MNDPTTTDVETADGDMPPLPTFDDEPGDPNAGLDDDAGFDDDENLDATDAAETVNPQQPGRRRRRRGSGRPFEPGHISPPSGRNPMPWEDRTLEWDQWADSFAWGNDNTLRLILKRLAPTRGPNGVEISGVLETRETAPIHLEEIRGTYGGGEYEAAIVGLHPASKDTRPRVMSRRRIRIPGLPNTSEMPRGAAPGRPGMPDPIAKTAMDMVREEVTSLRRRGEESPRLVEKTIDTMQQVSEQRAKAAEVGATARIELINQQLIEQRARSLDLEKRLRDTETDMFRKTTENQEKLAQAVTAAQGSSLSVIMELLPTLSGKADEQVRQMTMLYSAKEERLAAEYKSQLQQMQANFQSQRDAERTLFQVQLETTKAQYEHTVALLQNEMNNARAEVQALQRQLEHMRTVLDQKNQEIMTKVLEQRNTPTKSAVEQMTELGGVFEAMENMKGFFGGNQAPTDDLEGVESPITRKLLKMGEGLIQNAPGILEAIKNRQGQPPGPPPGYPPPGYPPPGYQMMPQQPQAQAPVQRRPAPVAQPPVSPSSPTSKPRVKKEDVEAALTFINNVLEAGGEKPPAPSDVAQMAVTHADNAVLKALSSRKPENVIEQLETQGMLKGTLTTEVGKKYLTELLVALKAHFA